MSQPAEHKMKNPLAEKLEKLASAVRTINYTDHHIAQGLEDDEPCYWQRKEWIDYVLSLCDEAEQVLNAQHFRENADSTTKHFRENRDSSTNQPPKAESAQPIGWYIVPTDLVPPFYTEDESRMYREIRNGSIAKPRYDSPPSSPELTVWYGSMPESNGKSNWTAILHRKGEPRSLDGMTIDRSEYPERVKYAADRVRYLLGELVVRPCISSYNSDAHSGYVAKVHPNEVCQRLEWLTSDAHNAACNLDIGDDRTAAFELYEVLRRLQRRGAASHILSVTNPLMVEGLNHPVNPDSWFDCQAIANIEEVDSALRELVDNTTGDNGVRVVQAILRSLKAS